MKLPTAPIAMASPQKDDFQIAAGAPNRPRRALVLYFKKDGSDKMTLKTLEVRRFLEIGCNSISKPAGL